MSSTSASGSGGVLQSRRSLYVGGLADEVSEATLRAAMIPFGPIKSVELPMDYAQGTHKGFGFVEFEDADDAAEALYNMNGAELYGRTLNVSLAQPGHEHRLGSNKAVWSTDEWFREHVGAEAREDEQKRKAAAQDQSTLQEDATTVPSSTS